MLHCEIYWLVSDHLGTPRLIAERTGKLEGIKRSDYLPYGESANALGGRAQSQGYAGESVRQGFTGYEEDSETGLDFAQARYLSSTQGRFISVDPLMASAATGEPQSWNRYVYVSNNPLNLTDPTGMLQKPPVVSTITADDVRSDSQTLDGADDAPPQEPVQLPVVPKLDPHTKAPPQKRTFGDNEDNSPYAFQFSLGLLPPPPSQGPLPANSSASQVGSETRTPNLIETEAVITILDERNNRLASDGETFIVSEIIAEVTVSADLSQAAPEIGKPRFVLPDGTVNDVHTLRPRSGVRQFSESTYYLRRQIITVENSNTNKKYVVGYFLLETTATGLVITNCNRGCP